MYSSRFTSKSCFDDKGGNALKKRDAVLYKDIVAKSARSWLAHIGTDGVAYDSAAEMLVANLLHANAPQIEFRGQVPIDLKGPGGRVMVADFLAKDRGTGRRVCIEVWGVSPKRANQRDPYVQGYLRRRKYKEKNSATYPAPLVAIEAQVLRDAGAPEFLAHVQRQLSSAGIKLSREKIAECSQDSQPYSEMPPEKIADIFFRHGHTTVSEALRGGHRVCSSLARKIFDESRTAEIEPILANLSGRTTKALPSLRADRSEIEVYIRHRRLTKSAYMRSYKARELPAGFPMSPRQHWKDFSWSRLNGLRAPRSERIRNYDDAKAFVSEWQERCRVDLRSGTHFERVRKTFPELMRLPAQPDNRKSGGLDDWRGWEDFLGLRNRAKRS